jgi:hypothetical protein
MERAGAIEMTLEALDTTSVRLAGVRAAGEVIPDVGPRRFLHSGPPVELEEAPAPMRGAIMGGLVLEEEAESIADAATILESGEVELVPCHDAGAVGAMAGIVTPRMPLVVAESEDGLHRAFAPLNEGLGRALRFGSHDDATLARLRWMSTTAGPVLDAAIGETGAIDLTELVAEGLRRGDECHNRNVATTANLVALLAPAAIRVASRADAADVLAHAAQNRHFGLSFSISVAKVLADAASHVPGSPIVTAVAGNGVRLGIRVSGTGDRWFTAPAPIGEARFFVGFDREDAQPLMGDSMITETAGFGCFAITAAPAIVSFVGGTVAEAGALVEAMRGICAGTSSRFRIPSSEFAGTPLGIDVHRVAESRTAPVVDNGISHREAGVGQVGAGLTRLPLEPFLEASEALRRSPSRAEVTTH